MMSSIAFAQRRMDPGPSSAHNALKRSKQEISTTSTVAPGKAENVTDLPASSRQAGGMSDKCLAGRQCCCLGAVRDEFADH